jgi:hypothetical protein
VIYFFSGYWRRLTSNTVSIAIQSVDVFSFVFEGTLDVSGAVAVAVRTINILCDRDTGIAPIVRVTRSHGWAGRKQNGRSGKQYSFHGKAPQYSGSKSPAP